jgi:hypothetical protein
MNKIAKSLLLSLVIAAPAALYVCNFKAEAELPRHDHRVVHRGRPVIVHHPRVIHRGRPVIVHHPRVIRHPH